MEQNDVFWEQNAYFRLLRRRYRVRIAICDDNPKLIKEVEPVLYKYANRHRLELAVDGYCSGEALLSSVDEYDIVFLDYQMGGLNGLETAKVIRSRNMLSKIVFLTDFPYFVYEAFKVDTFRFFPKPIYEADLFQVMDDYFAKYGNDYPLQLRCNREVVTLNTREIVLVRAKGKHCSLHLQDRKLECTQLMVAIESQLPRTHFFKVARDYIINFHYIDKYNKEYIFFKNGDKVPISRKYSSDFKDNYRRYTARKNA